MQRQKISRFEAILITAIILMAAFFIGLALIWPSHSAAHRDDALWANTALSVGIINSDNGQDCVVNECPHGGLCTHHTVNGYVGYFDPSTNTIAGEKPAGYNEETTIRLDGKKYRGRKGTLVIRVISDNNDVTVDWVEGNQ